MCQYRRRAKVEIMWQFRFIEDYEMKGRKSMYSNLKVHSEGSVEAMLKYDHRSIYIFIFYFNRGFNFFR